MPFSILGDTWGTYKVVDQIESVTNSSIGADSILSNLESSSSIKADTSTMASANSGTKDYSTTNIQVENVDEADITKTDGNYIYSISEYGSLAANTDISSVFLLYGINFLLINLL